MQALATLLLLASATPAPTPEAGEGQVMRRLASMGTGLEIEVQAVDRRTALLASEAAVRALEATEARLSTWVDDSELAHLNATPVDGWFELSPTLARELGRAHKLWLETGGAFDPGVGALINAWDLRGQGRIPSDQELSLANSGSSLRHLELQGNRAQRRHPQLRLEEGAFGKGAGLDRALEALKSSGASRASVDLGGQLAFLGTGTFEVQVADPIHRDRTLLSISVPAGSVATSGNSEQARLVDGVPLGHLLDPRTGTPTTTQGSMTVWSQSALDADALATGLFVLGADKALDYAAQTPGVEVLVLVPTGDEIPCKRFTARFSEGLSPRVSALPEDRKRVLLFR